MDSPQFLFIFVEKPVGMQGKCSISLRLVSPSERHQPFCHRQKKKKEETLLHPLEAHLARIKIKNFIKFTKMLEVEKCNILWAQRMCI